MLNEIQLIGNVGQDPEIKDFENNKVANFTLATTERGFKTKDGREIPERTEWHRIVVWGGLAKVVESYVKKGSQIYIKGKIKTRDYSDSAGVKRYVTEVYADNLILLGGKKSQDATETPQQNYSASMTGDGAEDDLPFFINI